MGLLKSRSRFSNRGLGNLEVREVSPTNDAAYQNLGYLEESNIADIEEVDVIKDENGSVQNALPAQQASRMTSKLLQVSIDEINYIKNSSTKFHSVRYNGMANEGLFQYFCFPYGRIIRKIERQFVRAKQNIPFEFLGLKQEATYDIPEFYMAEAAGKIRPENLQLWINPRSINAYNSLTAKVLDISGFERHGDLNSDFAAIWQAGTTPERFLRFDGVNDQLDLGNILNDDGTSDFMIEAWIRIQSADGGVNNILGKKTDAGTSAGFIFRRQASNSLDLVIADGTTATTISAGTVLQNVWKHVAFAIDRNGNGTGYLNGVAGAPVSVASINTATNALSLFIGRTAFSFSPSDISMLRYHKYGAGLLPADIATIIANHYNAEKSYHGL